MFALGPVVAATLTQAATPALALAGSAFAHLLGSVVMATSPLLIRPAPPAHDHPGPQVGNPPAADAGAPAPGAGESAFSSHLRRVLGPLARPGYVAMLVFTIAVGLGNDPLEVAVVARGQQAGASTAGVLLAVLSVSAALGGLVWGQVIGSARGARLAAVSPWSVLAALAAVTAVAASVPALMSGLAWLTVALVVVGAASAPLAVVTYTAADRFSTDDGAGLDGGSEATSWVNTAFNLGASLGTAGAGVLVDVYGIDSAFCAGAGVTAVAAGGAWLQRLRDRATACG